MIAHNIPCVTPTRGGCLNASGNQNQVEEPNAAEPEASSIVNAGGKSYKVLIDRYERKIALYHSHRKNVKVLFPRLLPPRNRIEAKIKEIYADLGDRAFGGRQRRHQAGARRRQRDDL